MQIIHDDERDLSLSEEEDDDKEENQWSSKEGKPWSALCTFFLPRTNLFSDMSNNRCVFPLFTSCKAIVYFKIPCGG